MAIKAVVETLDDVPEALKEHYKETENGYELDLGESIREHSGAQSLKNALDTERDKRKKAIEDRDKYKEAADKLPEDFDPEEYERLKANGEGGEEVQKKVEEARERERKKWEKKLNEATEERDQYKENYTSTKKDNGLKDALSQVNVVSDLKEYAEEYWSNRTQIDEDGNLVTSDGTPLQDAVKEWAESDKGKHFIAAPGNGGGGAPGGKNAGGSPDNPWKKDSFNLTHQMEILNKEPDKAKRLKAEAGVE